MITITIRWGAYPDPYGADDKTYTFDTQAEADAFLYGIEQAVGWLEWEVISK
jgi:hypothetical protein